MVLLRRVIGDALRARRQEQHRTLREVSSAANVSLGYLSEIERGQKEASSELLAAICEALGARLSEVLREVSDTVELAESVSGVLVPAQERPDPELVPAAAPAAGPDGRPYPDATSPRTDPAPVRTVAPPSREAAVPSQPAATGPTRRGAAEPVRRKVVAGPARRKVVAEPVRQSAPAEPAPSRSTLAEPVGTAHADRGVRALPAEALRQRPVDGAVSVAGDAVVSVAGDGVLAVTVHQESPLRTTLRATRRIHANRVARDVVCAA